jgi:hypothetical protein
MKYLCLIHLNEAELAAMPADELNALNARHVAFNESLRKGGNFVDAYALEPSAAMATVRFRGGKPEVVDGPYAETKELIAGFYLIEASDRAEAIEIASRIPSAPLGMIEVRPVRPLIVDGEEIFN